MSIDISVAICTYNRADMLTGALESLCQQTLSSDRFEIIVVDNASTDNTSDVVCTFQEKYSAHQIRKIYEVKQGLGFARNAALQVACGEYIAYLDDDARASLNWLATAMGHLGDTQHPQCLGGPIYPFYTTEKPAWFKEKYEARTWGDLQRYLEPGESLSGSNMIWNKETLKSIGGFGEMVGVKGKTLSVGEETIAFKRFWQEEHTPVVIYDPDLVVTHWVPPLKMKISYFLKRAFVVGQAAVMIDRQPGFYWRLRTWLRSGGAVVLLSVRAITQLPRYRKWQNWAVEECPPAMTKLGTFMALCGFVIHVNQRE